LLNKFWEEAKKEDIKGIKLSVGIAGEREMAAPAPQDVLPTFAQSLVSS
jgi:hypothetical protein